MDDAFGATDEHSFVFEPLHPTEIMFTTQINDLFQYFGNVKRVYGILVSVVTSHAIFHNIGGDLKVLKGLGKMQAVRNIFPKQK